MDYSNSPEIGNDKKAALGKPTWTDSQVDDSKKGGKVPD